MRLLGTEVDLPRALLVGVAGLVVLALVLAGLFSTAAFGAYNPSWDGTTDLRALADERAEETVIAREVDAYGEVDPGETVAVVLSPTEAYGENDTDRLRQFVEEGGTLVVAEDFGPHANPLLAALGVGTRVDGTLVRDERFYYRAPALPVATNVSGNHTLTRGVEEVTLNYGTVLEPGPNATVPVSTSAFAYLDRNASGELDETETVASFPVVAVEAVEEGEVVAVSDPSIFLNTMFEREGNRRFATNLVANETVLLDLSHTSGVPPLAAVVLVLRESPLALGATGTMAVVLFALWGRGSGGWMPVRVRRRLAVGSGGEDGAGSGAQPDTGEVVAAVTERHPDWDAERVERVTQELNRSRPEKGDNGPRDA